MRRALVILVVLSIPAIATAQMNFYPMTSLAEDATATWCGYCPDAYDGLEVVHSTYDKDVFLSARYYATSGDLGTPETDAAIAYYGITGYPTVVFNGTEHVVGGGAAIATGGPYLSIVDPQALAPAPVSIIVDSFDSGTGAVSATVTMYSPSEIFDGSNPHAIKFILLEDNVVYVNNGTHIFQNVTRDIINDSITLDGGQGDTAVFSPTFDTSLVVNPGETHVAVFVQREADRAVVQAASSEPPDYRVRAVVPFSRLAIGESFGTYTSERFTVFNPGFADDYSVNLIIDQAPAGWTVEYCDSGDNCFSTAMPLSLSSGQVAEYYVKVMPTSPGFINYHFQVDSTVNGSHVTAPFSYFTNDIEVLIVDDDGGQAYEDYFTAALDASGISYGVWDLSKGGLTDTAAQTFPLMIWSAGPGYPSQADVDFLSGYLDDGNSLLITGQDVGWGLDYSGAAGIAFLNNYLHASYIRDDTNILDLDGVIDDPVSDGLQLHIGGGDGANNQVYPEEIGAFDADAVEIFYYVGNYCGAVRSTDSVTGALVVYLGFGYEAIDNPADRAALMDAAVRWLQGQIFADGFETNDSSAWSLTVQ